MQNGLGLDWKIANRRAIVVITFSPPEKSIIDLRSFPGGWAIISIPASRISTPSSKIISALPPPNNFRKSSWKWLLISWNVFSNNSRLVTLILFIISCKAFSDVCRSSIWAERCASLSSSSVCSWMASKFTLPILSTLALSSSISLDTLSQSRDSVSSSSCSIANVESSTW